MSDGYAAVSSATPSQCCLGYILDPDAPAYLGQGFGPKLLWEMFGHWNTVCGSGFEKYDETQRDHAKQLANVLNRFPSQGTREENFSCPISVSLHRLLSTFSAFQGFHLVHQVHLANSMKAADIVAVDAGEVELRVHGVLEVKWEFSKAVFPEMQGSAFACLFNGAGDKWMPIFVLTKNYFELGICWSDLCEKGAYSSIFTSKIESFTSEKTEHILDLLHFAEYLSYSLKLHRDLEIKSGCFDTFCDRTGADIPIVGPFSAAGDRVILGFDASTKAPQVLKFYQNAAAANDAFKRATKFAEVLNYTEFSAKVYQGFGPLEDATCVVAFNYYAACEWTYQHLIDLMNQVEMLALRFLLHGDMRFLNLIPMKDGSVRAIDFDWAGVARRYAPKDDLPVATFPGNVNPAAFGSGARDAVKANKDIRSDFDIICLVDLLIYVGCGVAAKCLSTPLQGFSGEVVSERFDRARELLMNGTGKNVTDLIPKLAQKSPAPLFLNLRAVSGRVGDYYRNTRIVVKTPKRTYTDAAAETHSSSAGAKGS